MDASVKPSWVRARSVSNAVPRPASSRCWVTCSVRRWFSALLARHGQPLLRAAQLEVGPRQLGRQRHLHVSQVLAGGADQRALGLHAPADPAEEVELPRGVEAAVPDVLVGEAPGRRWGTSALESRWRV